MNPWPDPGADLEDLKCVYPVSIAFPGKPLHWEPSESLEAWGRRYA